MAEKKIGLKNQIVRVKIIKEKILMKNLINV